jgi:hypothetical protein
MLDISNILSQFFNAFARVVAEYYLKKKIERSTQICSQQGQTPYKERKFLKTSLTNARNRGLVLIVRSSMEL